MGTAPRACQTLQVKWRLVLPSAAPRTLNTKQISSAVITFIY